MSKKNSDERKMEMPNDKDFKFTDNVNPFLFIPSDKMEANNFTFNTGSEEILKFCANGDIYIRGKLVENDKEVVQGMRDFLKTVPKS
jgi:hypothetical protein